MKKTCFFFVSFVLVCMLFTACSKAPTWQEQYDLGVKYLSEGNYAEAVIAFTAAIEIDPKRPEAFIGRGGAYIGTGETAENLALALGEYESALELDETLADAWLGLADVYIRQGEYDKALEVLREALEKAGGAQSVADKVAEMEAGSYIDSAGNIRRLNSYDGAGTLVWYHTYTYDQQNRQDTVTSYDAAGTQTGQVDLLYDEAGNELQSYFYYDESGIVGRIENQLDAQGRVILAWHHNPDGGSEEFRYTYDEQGNCIEEQQYGEDGQLSYTTHNEFDANGNMLKQSLFDRDGNLFVYYLFEYTEDGKQLAQSGYSPEGQLEWRVETRYDENGNYLGYDTYDGNGNLTQSATAQS